MLDGPCKRPCTCRTRCCGPPRTALEASVWRGERSRGFGRRRLQPDGR